MSLQVAAHLVWREESFGMAGLGVLDRHLFGILSDDIGGTVVLKTVAGGRTMHDLL